MLVKSLTQEKGQRKKLWGLMNWKSDTMYKIDY